MTITINNDNGSRDDYDDYVYDNVVDNDGLSLRLYLAYRYRPNLNVNENLKQEVSNTNLDFL